MQIFISDVCFLSLLDFSLKALKTQVTNLASMKP